MSEQRQVIEFLRRRYASAILRDDAETAGRLRAQLDRLINHAGGPPRADRAGAPVASAAPTLNLNFGNLNSGETARR